ncbi:hypothetical protein [Clavibacter zhangzhiyongii]|uniref:hypothetical protein n=1 Tax=Clavibacter TaxID=1573 RepID=UPI0039E1332E
MSTLRDDAAPHDDAARHAAGPSIPLRDRLAPDLAWTAAHVRRRVAVIVAVVLGSAVVAGVLLLPLRDHLEGGIAEILALVVQAGCTGGAIACAVVAIQLQIAAAPLVHGLSAADRTLISRRMLGAREPLDPEAEWRAARFAAFARVSHPFGLGVIGLMWLAALPFLVRSALDGAVLGIAGTVLFVLFIPLLAWEQRRRMRYAEASRHLAWSSGPATDARLAEGALGS